ncbi:hypothetical protein [Mastigocladopsis repens]|uniref:hypothetical protein n=1 Tax=Mastigocladopsis repens TaxID=221287 RepID=UPI000368E932|nr:hypothetical protein [Mastigocladopsis repens]
MLTTRLSPEDLWLSMTQSVADKTPIPDKALRRHSDPQTKWIAVATISVALHLLLFWLLRSYSYNLLLQRSSSNPVSVDFVEISSRRKAPSKAKPVSPKRASTTQKSAVARSSKPVAQENLTAKSTSTVEDSNAIALTNTNKARTSQPKVDITPPSSQRPIFEQKEAQPKPQPATSEPTRQLEPTPSPTPFDNETPEPTPSPTPFDNETPEPTPSPTPFDNENLEPTPSPNTADSTDTDTQNQANQELGEQNQASKPQNNTTDSTPTDSSAETGEQPQPPSDTGTPEIPGQPDGEVTVGKGTPLEDIAPPVKPQQSPLDEQKGGGVALATWEIEADAIKKDIQDNPPQIVGDIREKELEFLALNRELGDQPIEFRAVLLIDSSGNLNSILLDPSLKIPEAQATQYQEYAEEIFKGQKFIPASNDNGNNPPLSELVVRIRIQRKSPSS